jgi:hypothetical protein
MTNDTLSRSLLANVGEQQRPTSVLQGILDRVAS